MIGIFDENIHPCKGCEDYEPPNGCKSKGGCGGLLNCPKCGSENVNATNWGMWTVWCRDCLYRLDGFLIERDAITAWNGQ